MMKKHSIVAVASAAAALSLVLAGCSGSGTPKATTSGGSTLPTATMMVGGIDKQIYLPYLSVLEELVVLKPREL